MEHPAPLSSPQPWRLAAIVAAAVAALELFILVVVGIAFASKVVADGVQEPAPARAQEHAAAPAAGGEAAAAAARPHGEASASLLPRTQTSVLVLNGNGVVGAAGVEAERVRRLNYLIAGTGNASRTDFGRSLVMYRPGREGEAARLAADLKLKRVVPLDGMKLRDLQGAHLALIVGG